MINVFLFQVYKWLVLSLKWNWAIGLNDIRFLTKTAAADFCLAPVQAVSLCAFRKTWCPVPWRSSAWVSPWWRRKPEDPMENSLQQMFYIMFSCVYKRSVNVPFQIVDPPRRPPRCVTWTLSHLTVPERKRPCGRYFLWSVLHSLLREFTQDPGWLETLHPSVR